MEGAIKATKGRNVVFIFDGFNEYSPDSNSDIVLNLMETWRNFLRDAFVVVKLSACQDFRQYADKQIEVIGFLKEHIFKVTIRIMKAKRRNYTDSLGTAS